MTSLCDSFASLRQQTARIQCDCEHEEGDEGDE